MSPPPTVHIFAPHEWRTYRELRLRALTESPDAFGSTIEKERERTDHEWVARLAVATDISSQIPLVARVGPEPIGLAWGRREGDPEVAHLFQVWVAPECRGLGAGRLLVDAAIAWARNTGARYLDLEATCGDTPAMRLYLRAGFLPIGDPVPLRPGSPLMEQPMRLGL